MLRILGLGVTVVAGVLAQENLAQNNASAPILSSLPPSSDDVPLAPQTSQFIAPSADTLASIPAATPTSTRTISPSGRVWHIEKTVSPGFNNDDSSPPVPTDSPEQGQALPPISQIVTQIVTAHIEQTATQGWGGNGDWRSNAKPRIQVTATAGWGSESQTGPVVLLPEGGGDEIGRNTNVGPGDGVADNNVEAPSGGQGVNTDSPGQNGGEGGVNTSPNTPNGGNGAVDKSPSSPSSPPSPANNNALIITLPPSSQHTSPSSPSDSAAAAPRPRIFGLQPTAIPPLGSSTTYILPAATPGGTAEMLVVSATKNARGEVEVIVSDAGAAAQARATGEDGATGEARVTGTGGDGDRGGEGGVEEADGENGGGVAVTITVDESMLPGAVGTSTRTTRAGGVDGARETGPSRDADLPSTGGAESLARTHVGFDTLGIVACIAVWLLT